MLITYRRLVVHLLLSLDFCFFSFFTAIHRWTHCFFLRLFYAVCLKRSISFPWHFSLTCSLTLNCYYSAKSSLLFLNIKPDNLLAIFLYWAWSAKKFIGALTMENFSYPPSFLTLISLINLLFCQQFKRREAISIFREKWQKKLVAIGDDERDGNDIGKHKICLLKVLQRSHFCYIHCDSFIKK